MRFLLFSSVRFLIGYTFSCSQSGPDERNIPGNSVAVHADMPFTGLTNFGGSFLSKFECAQMPHPVSFDFLETFSISQILMLSFDNLLQFLPTVA